MELIINTLQVLKFAAEVGVAIILVLSFAWISTMIYDEIRTEEGPFKIFLTVGVFGEALWHRDFARAFGIKAKKEAYKARHRLAEEFIDDLVVEMRQMPGSLCYNDPFSEENIAKHYALAA
jgi:hypothetical protein